MIDERLLDNAGPLAAANAAARRELVVRAIARDYRAGATLFRAGSVAKTLYVILSGEVRVVRATAGRLHVLHSEGAGGTLGDAPMFEPVGDPTAASGRYLATAEATRDTRCLTLTRDALASVLAADPDLAWMFLGRLATRVRDFVARLDRVTARDAKSRLAEWLLAQDVDADGIIASGLTQAALAEELGTVREVVVRGLRTLCELNVIEGAGRAKYRIVDADSLRRIALGLE